MSYTYAIIGLLVGIALVSTWGILSARAAARAGSARDFRIIRQSLRWDRTPDLATSSRPLTVTEKNINQLADRFRAMELDDPQYRELGLALLRYMDGSKG